MGGGGGGAGGAVRIVALGTVSLGSSLVQVNGAGGGASSCGSANGGAGALGRIGIAAATITGTTSPAFDRN